MERRNHHILEGMAILGFYALNLSRCLPLFSIANEQQISDLLTPEVMAAELDAEAEGVSETLPEKEPEYFEDCLATDQSWTGVGSRYSEAGCIGCRDDRLMANGQRFNEHAMTLAFWRAPLGSKVRVTNLDKDIREKAEVTDHGGFDKEFNPNRIFDQRLAKRIFDLSKGLGDKIGLVTDLSQIEITILDCR